MNKIKCRKCKNVLNIINRTFKNGTKHLQVICACGANYFAKNTELLNNELKQVVKPQIEVIIPYGRFTCNMVIKDKKIK